MRVRVKEGERVRGEGSEISSTFHLRHYSCAGLGSPSTSPGTLYS